MSMSVPDLVWTESAPPSTESESNDVFFAPPPVTRTHRSPKKLRKLAHPPPSFNAFSASLYATQSDLSFIPDEPPSAEHSNFPYLFAEPAGRTSVSLDYERTLRSQSDSGHSTSHAYPRSLESSSSRPLTFLSLADSRTPLLRSLSALGTRRTMPTPTRKLTKPKPAPSPNVEYRPLHVPESKTLPLPPPPPPSKSVELLPSAPKRRPTISFGFTVALKRRFSTPKGKAKEEDEDLPSPRSPHRARSTPHVRTMTSPPPSTIPLPASSLFMSTPDKHLPSLPPPTPPAKDTPCLTSSASSSVPSPPPASSKQRYLRKERKDLDKPKQKKFSIGGEDSINAELPALFTTSQTLYTSDPLPLSLSPTDLHPEELVYDLSLDHDPQPSGATTPRLRAPLTGRHEGLDDGQGESRLNSEDVSPSATHSGSSVSNSRTQRRWTLALAMTSDELSDEVFVEQVENIRHSAKALEEQQHWAAVGRVRSVEGVGGFRGWEFGYLDPDDDSEDEEEEEGYEDDPLEEGYTVARPTSPSMPDLVRPVLESSSPPRKQSVPPRSVSALNMRPTMEHPLPRSSSSNSHQLPNSNPNPNPAVAWSSALHALLITRDLLRTEKNYSEQLKVLLGSSPCAMSPATPAVAETSLWWTASGRNDCSPSSTAASMSALLTPIGASPSASSSSSLPWPAHPPPPLMHTYLLSLIALSLTLLCEWEKDPSVSGVGRVLVEKEEEIERVFVGWCGVVGGWFSGQDGLSKAKKNQKSRKQSGESAVEGVDQKKRSRRLSKSKFSANVSPASLSSLSANQSSVQSLAQSPMSNESSFLSASIASTSQSSTPPTAFPASSSTPNTIARRRHIERNPTTTMEMSSWRKSLPDVAVLNNSSINPRPLPVPPKSAGHMVATFNAQIQETPPPLPISTQKGTTRVRRASMFLSLRPDGHDAHQNREWDERRRGIEKDPTPTADVSRSRSHSVLPRLASGSGSCASGHSEYLKSNGVADARGRRIHSVRELGILPVQRVTRYALLFRDLLKYTPATSPSRPLMERAAESASRIAAKCDRAQGNAEFFFGSTGVGR